MDFRSEMGNPRTSDLYHKTATKENIYETLTEKGCPSITIWNVNDLNSLMKIYRLAKNKANLFATHKRSSIKMHTDWHWKEENVIPY